MSLIQRIQSDMVEAMRRKEGLRLATLRMAKTAVTNKRVEKGAELSDEEVHRVLETLVKQRRDSAEQFRKGGRNELAEKEESEIEVLEAYLPRAATEEEIHAVIGEVIAELEAAGPKDMGRVMKETLARLRGKTVDGGQVSQWVKQQLTG
jgi:hypothetical protein